MRKLIETIAKNKREEIRVALTKYEGHDLCDVRVFVEPYSGDERVATKKGLSMSVAKLPDLIKGLQKAEAEARAAGLLEGPNTEDRPQDDAAGADVTILSAG